MSTWGSVILWLSMIWLPPLLGLFLRNEAKPKKNIIVGTTLPHEAQGDPAVLALTARYKRELKWVCLALMLPAIPGVFIRDFGLNMLLWMIWILVICVAVNIPYVRCNRALRRLKADRGWRREPSGQAVADLRAAAMDMDMAYSKAWTILRNAERQLGVKLLQSRAGGRHGGGATLTEEGERLLAAYEVYVRDLEAAGQTLFQQYFGEWLDE